MIKQIIHKLVLSCEEATLLLEKQDADQISLFQNIRLNIHLAICKFCKIYKQKSSFINQYFEDKINSTDTDDHDTIERLKEKINNKIAHNKQ